MTNFKNVLKVFKAMREFDSDDHALLNTLRNATEADIELLIEAVGPVKRITTKRTRKTSKSPRAASLAGAIAERAANKETRCVAMIDDNSGQMACEELASSPVHKPDGGYAGYHPFTPVVAQSAAGGD